MPAATGRPRANRDKQPVHRSLGSGRGTIVAEDFRTWANASSP